MLNIFSDAVRPAYSRLEALARKENGSTQLTDRLAEYPHRDETNRVLAYNWDTVLKHQEEASNVVLERLARTTKEVQGLMDGVRQCVEKKLPQKLMDQLSALQRTVRDGSSEEQAFKQVHPSLHHHSDHLSPSDIRLGKLQSEESSLGSPKGFSLTPTTLLDVFRCGHFRNYKSDLLDCFCGLVWRQLRMCRPWSVLVELVKRRSCRVVRLGDGTVPRGQAVICRQIPRAKGVICRQTLASVLP